MMQQLDEKNKKKYEEELHTRKEKHNKHEKLNHPANKAQFDEVWEKQDHMSGQQFNPKTFFMIHGKDFILGNNPVYFKPWLREIIEVCLDKKRVYAGVKI